MPDDKLKTKDIKNLFLFSNGIFNGEKTTLDQLKKMYANWKLLKNKYKLNASGKITHEQSEAERDSKHPGLESVPFAFGDLDNVRMEDTGKVHPVLKEPIYKMYGDLISAPDYVVDWWDRGLLRNVSLEVLPRMKMQDGTVLERVIESVALLGHEPPALWEAKAYSIDSERILLSNSKDISEFEPALIYQAIENNPNKNIEIKEEKTPGMTEEQYGKKIQKYSTKGIKCKDYSIYSVMDEEKQNEYMSMMEDKFNKMSNDEKDQDSKKTFALAIEEVNNLKSELQAEREALKTEREAALTEEKKTYALEVQSIREEREALARDRKADKVEKVMYSLLHNEAGSKIPARIEGKVRAALQIADDSKDKKVNYSLSDGKDAESPNLYSLLTEIFNDLPVDVRSATGEQLETEDGITVTNVDRNISPDMSDEDIAEQKRTNKAVYAMAEKLGIDVDVSFDNYQKVLSRVIAGV